MPSSAASWARGRLLFRLLPFCATSRCHCLHGLMDLAIDFALAWSWSYFPAPTFFYPSSSLHLFFAHILSQHCTKQNKTLHVARSFTGYLNETDCFSDRCWPERGGMTWLLECPATSCYLPPPPRYVPFRFYLPFSHTPPPQNAITLFPYLVST